jgi:hypothetical protein
MNKDIYWLRAELAEGCRSDGRLLCGFSRNTWVMLPMPRRRPSRKKGEGDAGSTDVALQDLTPRAKIIMKDGKVLQEHA